MNITIRKARPEEAETLTDISMRSKQSAGYDDAFMEACREELKIHPEDIEHKHYWVAETKQVCGVIGLDLEPNGDTAEVSSFFIDPAFKRQGIGRLMWQEIVAQAQDLGLKSLSLASEPAAVPFYSAMGLAIVGEVPSGSIKGRVLPKMELVLR